MQQSRWPGLTRMWTDGVIHYKCNSLILLLDSHSSCHANLDRAPTKPKSAKTVHKPGRQPKFIKEYPNSVLICVSESIISLGRTNEHWIIFINMNLARFCCLHPAVITLLHIQTDLDLLQHSMAALKPCTVVWNCETLCLFVQQFF